MDTDAMGRTSAAFLAYESLGAGQPPAPSQARTPTASPSTTSFLQAGDPPATGEPRGAVATAVADAATFSNRIAANVAEPLTSRGAALRPGVINQLATNPNQCPQTLAPEGCKRCARG